MEIDAIIADTYGVEGLLKVEKAEGIITFEPPTIHDLFNELHRRLMGATGINSNDKLQELTTKLDALHHDYTDLTS